MAENKRWEGARAWPVYLIAAALPISMAAVSISKVALVLFGLAVLSITMLRRQPMPALRRLISPIVILVMLAALAASLAYTDAPASGALIDLGKYGKLLVLLLIPALVRTRREALIALGCYVAAQTFVVLTSYLLAGGLMLPWVYKPERTSLATVFSSHLDQTIMTAGMAALCWHLRGEFPGRYGPRIAVALALLATVNAVFLLPGRSGHVALLTAASLAVFWAVPRRLRLLALLAPLLLVAAALISSHHFRERLSDVVTETRAYEQGDPTLTSSGIRINFWTRSLQAIRERPFTGYGVGSW